MPYTSPDLPVEQAATIQGQRSPNLDRAATVVIEKIDGAPVASGLRRYKLAPGNHTISFLYSIPGRSARGELHADLKAGKAYVVNAGTHGYYSIDAWIDMYPQPGPDAAEQ